MAHIFTRPNEAYSVDELQTIVDQCIPYYATIAALDSGVTSPSDGMLANVAGSLHTYTGSDWVRISYHNFTTAYEAVATGQTVSSTTDVDITSATVSVSVVDGWPIWCTITIDGQMTADDGRVGVFSLNIGGSNETGALIVGSSERLTTSASWIYVPTSTTTVTVKAVGKVALTGSANCQVNAQSHITVWCPNLHFPAAT